MRTGRYSCENHNVLIHRRDEKRGEFTSRNGIFQSCDFVLEARRITKIPEGPRTALQMLGSQGFLLNLSVSGRIVSILTVLIFLVISNPLRLLATERAALDHFLGDVVVVRRPPGNASTSAICR